MRFGDQIVARGGRRVKIFALALSVTNLILWYAAPWLRDSFDALTGRLASPYRPMNVNGVQELLVYFDPWLARGVFPVVYTLGFVAIAFLFQPAADSATSGCVVLTILLLGFETMWLFLIAFAIFFRGPYWNFYWPWEAWNPKVVPLNSANFSEIFWWLLSDKEIVWTSWLVHETPGLLLAAGYLFFGLLVAYTLSRRTGHVVASVCLLFLMFFTLAPLFVRKILAPDDSNFYLKMLALLLATGLVLATNYLFFRMLKAWCRTWPASRPMAYWRSILLVLLVQIAALIPVKVILYWAFDMKYFIYFPKYFWNL